jgi:hypothetical protein
MEIVAVEQTSLQVLQFSAANHHFTSASYPSISSLWCTRLTAQYITTNAGVISSVTQHEARHRVKVKTFHYCHAGTKGERI